MTGECSTIDQPLTVVRQRSRRADSQHSIAAPSSDHNPLPTMGTLRSDRPDGLSPG